MRFMWQWFDFDNCPNAVTLNLPEPRYRASRIRGFTLGKWFVGMMTFEKIS